MKRTIYCLCTLLLLYLSACTKFDIDGRNTNELDKQVRLLKDSFRIRGYSDKLKENLQHNVIQWIPQWDAATKKSPGANQSFFYIPLKPVLLNAQGEVQEKTVTQLTSSRWLLVSELNGAYEFTDATYILDSTVSKDSSIKKFSNFSGTMRAFSLDYKRAYSFDYKNGAVSASARTRATIPRSANYAGRDVRVLECITIEMCRWAYEGCSDKFGPVVTATISEEDGGFCAYPRGFPSGCNFSSNGQWNLIYTQHDQHCWYVWEEEPPPPDEPDSWNPSGGGGNTHLNPPTKAQIESALLSKPFALFKDVPCDLLRSWLSVAKYTPGQNIIDKLNRISYPAPVAEFYGIKPSDLVNIQKIDDASSLVVNMDYFPIRVEKLPEHNGEPMSAGEFLNLFRLNINNFTSGKAIFKPYQAYGVDDVELWKSNSPAGSIINIDLAGPDNGSVITSHADPTRWIFTTIHEPIYGAHPVSGNRVFGYIENGDGSYTFYTQGVDRLTTMDASLLQEISESFGKGIPFGSADALWTTLQTNIANFVNDNGGEASSVSSMIHRPDWSLVKDVIDGKRPLSDLSKDCPDN